LSSSWEHYYRAVIFERAIKARMREIMDESITALDMTELSNALRVVRDLMRSSDH
jgi:hypothetical protein